MNATVRDLCQNMNPGIAYHEDILSRIVLAPNDFTGGTDYTLFRHSQSAFMFTQAYGRVLARNVCECADAKPAKASFALAAGSIARGPECQSRFLLKITAGWRNWEKQTHDVRIELNGATVYEGPFFLENILAGWPSQYFGLEPEMLRAGDDGISNTVAVTSLAGTENTLLLAGAEILRLNDVQDFSIHSVPTLVAVGEIFNVYLHLLGNETRTVRVTTPADGSVSFEKRGEILGSVP